MDLFIKGFIIGIAKVIPGVSGAMLAISFGLYDKIINAVTSFFDNKVDNFKFLLKVLGGVVVAIILFSNIIKFMINNYYFEVMLLFIGLIIGGVYGYSKNIRFNFKNIFIIIFLVSTLVLFSVLNISSNSYVIKGNMVDYLVFFIAGFIEIFSSIVPGISGTAILMILGFYDNVLLILSNCYNISFVFNNIWIYVSYSIGMIISFIGVSIFISFLIKKYRKLFDIVVFSLSISSILVLFILVFSSSFDIVSFVIGIMLFFIGIIISLILDK